MVETGLLERKSLTEILRTKFLKNRWNKRLRR